MKRLVCFLAVCCIVTGTAHADEERPHPDINFGNYGYRHHELHQSGVIDKLIRQSNKTCCDGGKGGECRVTSTRIKHGRKEAYLEGRWCPISRDVTIFTDIELPDGAFAVVCASIPIIKGRCPATYCAAEVPGI